MLTGIAKIDALHADANAPAITSAEQDKPTVGAIQDLLIGHGAQGLPRILDSARGVFGPKTEAAVASFQTSNNLAVSGVVDGTTLQALLDVPATTPITSQPYVALVLDLAWTGFTRLVALTAQFEAGGRFTACNRNTDSAGLSFGIIQWAQRPGRLTDIVRAFKNAQPDAFVSIFGAGDAQVASGLLAQVAKPNGGVDGAGKTTDPAYDLAGDTWVARFQQAGRDRQWQKTQLDVATTAFRDSYNAVRAAAPLAVSERAIAFLLDVANQHGDGGMRSICTQVAQPSMSEADFLLAVENESVKRLAAKFGDHSSERESTFERREAFRTTPILSDQPFQA